MRDLNPRPSRHVAAAPDYTRFLKGQPAAQGFPLTGFRRGALNDEPEKSGAVREGRSGSTSNSVRKSNFPLLSPWEGADYPVLPVTRGRTEA